VKKKNAKYRPTLKLHFQVVPAIKTWVEIHKIGKILCNFQMLLQGIHS